MRLGSEHAHLRCGHTALIPGAVSLPTRRFASIKHQRQLLWKDNGSAPSWCWDAARGAPPSPSPEAWRPPHHDDHVPELLQLADLFVTSLELLVVRHYDLEQAPGFAQSLHDALHGRDALLLLGARRSR